MKHLICILLIIIFASCTSQKNAPKTKETQPLAQLKSVVDNLNIEETNIVNDFLDVQLKKDRYKSYKDFEIVVIEEALKKYKSIETYEYSRNEWISTERINKIGDIENRFFLDTLQIKEIKTNLKKEEIYHWKISDFKNIKVSLLKYEDLIKTIRTSAYGSTISKRLIIYLSKPLIIDENNAFISFEIGNGQLGFGPINHFTVLMKKVNNKWEENNFYYDGVFY